MRQERRRGCPFNSGAVNLGSSDEVVAQGGKLLAEFAGVGNLDGVRHLLDLGVDAGARFSEGDGYWDVAKDSTALHVAAWRARHATVRLLIERGAPVDAPDGKGRTALALAVRACVDSYWTERRSPESVEALLRAGASVSGVAFPSGYAEVDELLRRHRTQAIARGRKPPARCSVASGNQRSLQIFNQMQDGTRFA